MMLYSQIIREITEINDTSSVTSRQAVAWAKRLDVQRS